MKSSPRQWFAPKGQTGQAIVLIALMMTVMFAAVGLAVDGGVGYYYNTMAERAAASAALSGVIFMPGQFATTDAIPAMSGNDASDRAIVEARRNGFDVTDVANNVTVTTARVAGFSNKLSVTVSRTVPVYFMQAFGVTRYAVSRTAIATYLPPLSLGQPGTQTGSTTAQLGSGGNNFFFMRTEGWSTDRQQGDAFTPNPAGSSLGGSADVHSISRTQGSDTVGASLPDRGGYNFLVDLPSGGYIRVYNAMFGPDNSPALIGSSGPSSQSWAANAPSGTTHNNCDNHISTVTNKPDRCSSGSSYYLHEEDSMDFASYGTSQKALYSAMKYTVLQVNTPFVRASDSIVSQVIVYPVDASGYWKNGANCTGTCSSPTKSYNPINNLGAYIGQTWDGSGNPTNMQTYHAWVDIINYTGASDGGTFQRLVSPASGPLSAGTYRLRVDTLGFDGANPPTNGSSLGGQAHKGYAVRVEDAAGYGSGTCVGCSVGAWNDMAVYTPISVPAGGRFDLPIFKVPPDYAGQTITVDVYDVGDMSGGGNVDLYILDNTSTAVAVTSPATVRIWDVGLTRTNSGPTVPCTGAGGLTNPPVPCVINTGSPQLATVRATTGGITNFNGHWLRFEIPVASAYAPGPNPANWWWSLRYQISTGVTATDTITVAIGLKGNPAHLLQS